LLHQPAFVGFQGFELLRLGGYELVKATQARGDPLLLGNAGERDWNPIEHCPVQFRLCHTRDEIV
jgi:hypothetical protein